MPARVWSSSKRRSSFLTAQSFNLNFITMRPPRPDQWPPNEVVLIFRLTPPFKTGLPARQRSKPSITRIGPSLTTTNSARPAWLSWNGFSPASNATPEPSNAAIGSRKTSSRSPPVSPNHSELLITKKTPSQPDFTSPNG